MLPYVQQQGSAEALMNSPQTFQPTGQWSDLVKDRLGLRFFLGDIPIASIGFGVLRDTRHFSQLEPWSQQGAPKIDWHTVPRAVQAMLYLSHPVDKPPRRLGKVNGSLLYVPVQYAHSYIDLASADDFDAYLAKFSSKSRNEIRRQVKKYIAFCGQEDPCREFSSPDEMDEFCALARQVSQRTYQEQVGHNGFPSGEAFLNELRTLAAGDQMRGHILFHGQRPIAYSYGTVSSDALVGQYIGYDPEYRDWSPGSVLTFLIVRRLVEEKRFRIWDFGHSEQDYKKFFATHTFPAADIHLFRPTLRNHFILTAHVVLNSAVGAVGTVLDRLGLKKKLKRLMRRGSN